MALRQNEDPSQPPDLNTLPLADSRRMKSEIEAERTMNEINSGHDLSTPIDPSNDSVLDGTLQGEQDPDGRRWNRQTRRVPQRLASTSGVVTDAAPEQDIGQSYQQMAQNRSTQVELDDFDQMIKQMRNEEFEKPKAPVPYTAPITGAPTADGAGSLPWYQHKTIPEVFQAVVNNAKDMTAADVGEGAWAVTKDVTKGLFWESPRAAARGVTTAGREFIVSALEFQNWFQTNVNPINKIMQSLGEIGVTEKPDVEKEMNAAAQYLLQYVPTADDVLDKPTTVTAGFGEEAVRFIVGFLPTFRAMRAINSSKTVGPLLGGPVGPFTQSQIRNRGIQNYSNILGAGTISEGITHPASDPNIAALVEMAPAFSNVVTQALQTNPDDSVGWAKVKHAISDGFISGIIADGLLYGLRTLAAKQAVVPEIEAQVRLHGNQEPGNVLAAGNDAPALSLNGPPPTNPFHLDVSTPEARTAAEGQVRAALSGDGGIRIEAQPIYDDIFQQLRLTGMPEDQAKANAAVWAQRYATRAERLNDGRSAVDLYREENVDVQRAAQEHQAEVAYNQDQSAVPPHVQRLYDEGQITSDGGATQDIVDLRELLRKKASPEEIEANPIVAAAYRVGMEVKPTVEAPGFGTPEWQANRKVVINGKEEVGYPVAQEHLLEKFRAASTNGPVKNEKRVIIVTGPGGSGKSTIMEPIARDMHAAIVDVDEAKALFPEYKDGLGANSVHEESSFITFGEGGPFRKLVEEGANMLIQKIGHSPESLRKLKELMEARGYKVDTVNVAVDPDEAFRRRIGRYLRTGRINSNGYNHSLSENADQPIKTHNLLAKEGFYGEAVQVDLNTAGANKVLSGEDTALGGIVKRILDARNQSGIDGGPGQRRSDGLLHGEGAGGNGGQVSLDQSGLIRSSALRIEGKIYEGPTHFDALLDYYGKNPSKANKMDDLEALSNVEADGFMTHDGKFISREEAARRTGFNNSPRGAQGGMGSEDLRMNGGIFDQSQPFYSSVERTVSSSTQTSATGPQWFAALRNTPGIKKEELDWLGVEKFLKDQTGQVSKSDLDAYIKANRVEVKEVVKTEQQQFRTVAEARRYLEEAQGDDPAVMKIVRGGNSSEMIRLANEFWNDLNDGAGGGTKFHAQQLPGGENYRELLLTIPTTDKALNVEVKKSDGGWAIFTNGRRTGFLTDTINGNGPLSEVQALQIAKKNAPDNIVGRAASQEGAFRNSHWDEPNVLAHVRMNDRVIDGKKTLFIEEIQSDWHQQGRRQGYRNSKPFIESKVDDMLDGVHEDGQRYAFKNKVTGEKEVGFGNNIEQARLDAVKNANSELRRSVHEGASSIPDAPFKKSWHELALKRIIRQAADEGYEQVAWTSGRQQTDRYDLSRQVESIQAIRRSNGNYDLTASSHSRGHTLGSDIPEASLADHVGKDLAEKIIDQKDKYKEYKGVDLRVGGEGMNAFYDKMLVNAANDIGKPFGAKADVANLRGSEAPTGERSIVHLENGTMIVRDQDGSELIRTRNYDEAKRVMDDHRLPETPVHVLPITENLGRVAKEQGFRLFQNAGEAQPPAPGATQPRGRITLGENQKLIQLFEKADASTFMHESSHLWLDELVRDAQSSPQMKADLDETLKWMGIDDPKAIQREHHEKWAASFEQYLATGEAPSEALKGVFDRFKDWLVSIYRTVSGVEGGALSPEIKAVFDRMLANDTELAASGRRRIFDENGNVAPEIAPALQGRLAGAGHDAIALNGANGPIVTRFDPSQMASMRKINDAFRTSESGVPTDVVARGVNEAQAGVARVVRAAGEPAGNAPEVYINFGRINAADDVKQVIADMANAFKPEIDDARRGVQTNEQTARLADDLGMTVEDLLNRQSGQPMNAEQSLAARRLLTTSAEQLKSLAERAALPNSSLADQYNFRKMMAVHHAIQSEVIAARTETARALQAWSINAGSTIEMSRDIASLIDSMGGSKTAQQMAQATADLFAAGVPPGAIATLTRRGWGATTMDAVKEMFTLGLLWQLPTHVANFASNLSVAFMQVYERASARMIGDLLDTGNGRIVAGEAIAMAYGMISSLKDAFRMAGVAVIKGKSEFGVGTKMDENLGAIGSHVISRERGHTLAEAEKFAATPIGRFLDFFGHVNQIPGHLLAAEDEFAKTIVWRGEVYAQALRQATEEGLGSFNERWSRMRELANDPPEQIKLNAVDSASYATFQSKMGNVGQAFMALRSGRLSPVFMVIPFVKTPTNILSYTFERTPLAPLVARWRDDFSAGGSRRDLALARMATGTAITAIAMDAASNGYITGSGPSDLGKKESWQRQGWQANSLRIGDTYYSFQRADPIGMLFGYAGTVAESMKASDLSPEKYDQATEILAAIIATFSSSVVDKTYFQGVEGVVKALQSSEQGDQGVANFINRQTGSLLPFSSFFNFHRKFVDPVQREINSPLDALKSKIAAWSSDLTPRRDLWGKEVAPQEVFGRAYDILSPVGVSKREDSPIDAEIERLNISLRRIQHKGTFAGADVNFHEWPKVYDKYITLAGNELKHPVWGVGLKDFLNEVVTGKHQMSQVYETLLSDGSEGGKAAWIKNQVSQYRKLAQDQIMKGDEFPEFVAWVRAREAQRIEMRLPTPFQGQGLNQR